MKRHRAQKVRSEERSASTEATADKGPRVVAVGKINKEGRETRVVFESMSEHGQAAVRHVFGENVRRAEEIANA